MVCHAACLLNLDSVGSDGKTPIERWRGRRLQIARSVFGERVWFKPNPLAGRSKAEARMIEGVFVGFRLKSSEYVVVAEGQIMMARAIRRKPDEERWSNPQEILSLPVSPWDKPGGIRVDEARPIGKQPEAPVQDDNLPLPPHWKWTSEAHISQAS